MMHRFLLILLATFSLSVAFTSQPTFTKKAVSTQLEMGFMDEVKSFMKKISVKAEASHILIKGGAEAVNKCEELKVEIGDNPAKFSAYAQQFSDCPSGSKGGSLGRFGPGAMVKGTTASSFLYFLFVLSICSRYIDKLISRIFSLLLLL
jgi:parvulin-like peptidyl-prolyl isomerase